ncbi:helix-turn-helix transcriptional regulator [Cyanobacterium stanieri LEGE 03274]|uniref:Helix-turn-helix transcriptional regulator n=1 Tax=Cyanobacterium stanieri LEGE 03274 TaxID=1828756 RepID=A0ABR9V5B0_9CHRO|nr:AraC family transcriptional regulator [Cyanobacterium stanieri]MBE9223042.1 helix-turn-helix transcriptional regulator [Cyanobacterium stanieri LEGE 03274]
MTISISSKDFYALWQEKINQGKIKKYSNNIETITEFPPQWGEGFWREIALRNGLNILIQDYYYHQPMIELDEGDDHNQLVSSFYLAGSYTSCVNCLHSSRQITPQNNHLFLIKNSVEKDELPAHKNILAIKLIISEKFLHNICFDFDHHLAKQLQKWVQGEDISSFLYSCQTDINIEKLLRQIINCPYQGCFAQMYWESKILELITLQFEQITNTNNLKNSKLIKDDIERIYHAKDILISHYKNPPSLIDLARKVGLNDYKLKKGFLQCFQMTVFGYLRYYRLLEAQKLIREYDFSIGRVALEVGYKSLGSFSSAFKAEFGISPKSYQQQCHG